MDASGTRPSRRDTGLVNLHPARAANGSTGCSLPPSISHTTSTKPPCGSCRVCKGTRRPAGSSIFPAVQNMLLAARALGLGATLTTLYLLTFEKEAEAALGLPPDWHSYALIPIGYPMGRFGPVRRVALEDVVFEDRWG